MTSQQLYEKVFFLPGEKVRLNMRQEVGVHGRVRPILEGSVYHSVHVPVGNLLGHTLRQNIRDSI